MNQRLLGPILKNSNILEMVSIVKHLSIYTSVVHKEDNKTYNGCSGNLCYTISKGTFIYKPHTDVGMVGRSAAGYLAQRKRL
jgi:hypothetical protein